MLTNNLLSQGLWLLQALYSLSVPEYKYILLYADDDILVSTEYLHQVFTSPMISHLSSLPLILGSVYNNPAVMRTGKNTVTKEEFRYTQWWERPSSKSQCQLFSDCYFSEDYFPSFCAGLGYFLSQAGLFSLVREYRRAGTEFLWLDDVFITGVLANKAGVKRIDIKVGMVIIRIPGVSKKCYVYILSLLLNMILHVQ